MAARTPFSVHMNSYENTDQLVDSTIVGRTYNTNGATKATMGPGWAMRLHSMRALNQLNGQQLLSKRRFVRQTSYTLRKVFWREFVKKNPGNGNRTRLEESNLGRANLIQNPAVQIFANLLRWGLDRRDEKNDPNRGVRRCCYHSRCRFLVWLRRI